MKAKINFLLSLILISGPVFILLLGFSFLSGGICFSQNRDKSVADLPALKPVVEAEEEVYQYLPADNGASPMWCSGSTTMVRIGNKVYASGLESVPEWKPFNNCRWMLFERSDSGWEKIMTDESRTREPSPMAVFHDGQFFLSANPTLTAPDVYDGPSRPEIFRFNSKQALSAHERLSPEWAGNPVFNQHSYRSLAADGASKELILFQNNGDSLAQWSFRNEMGKWSAQGQLIWPWGADYEVPEPIRICYPNVMLKGKAVYFCGVSDIIEPNKIWRDYKKELTGNEWDYDFRRLFFTWSDDITTGKFHPWIEIASREATCGWISPSDLWVAPDGAVHLLWSERALDERLREKFFPDSLQSHALKYAIVRNGKVEVRRTLAIAEEGKSNERPRAARFHVSQGNRLFVVYFVGGNNAAGKEIAENRLLELSSEGVPGSPVTIPLKQPFSSFFTATVRAGSEPSQFLDMLGIVKGSKNAIHYARIRLW